MKGSGMLAAGQFMVNVASGYNSPETSANNSAVWGIDEDHRLNESALVTSDAVFNATMTETSTTFGSDHTTVSTASVPLEVVRPGVLGGSIVIPILIFVLIILRKRCGCCKDTGHSCNNELRYRRRSSWTFLCTLSIRWQNWIVRSISSQTHF